MVELSLVDHQLFDQEVVSTIQFYRFLKRNGFYNPQND
jgi:hypothetical protein